jgi:hypothetical protein
MLYQIRVLWDDISSYTAQASNQAITLLRDINLYGGPYRARVVGFTWLDNTGAGTAASNHYIININSSKFVFPASASQGLNFVNKQDHVNPHLDGQFSFRIDAIAGDIDLNLQVIGFANTRTVDTTFTWNQTGFIAMVLSLDIEPLEDKRVAF